MAGNSLGTSYVQVVPKFKNGSLADMGKQAGSAFEGGFGAALKKVAGLLATSAIIKGIYDIGKAAVSAYADFEQLTGGVETLYKESADELIANAQRAYMTAGISANEYMEMSTSFAAALVNSLGGNTAEAARLADVAITDMSDNANKMGTDMEAIQNAYQGFAKQNYTMLDNLKLGYGGTRTEMERLLADAEAISGIHYDIENYSDVVSAIHVIQEEMGIAGTTAEEAASTISGSWGMLKASWENLLTSIAGGGVDIDTAVKAVFDSLMTWLGNIGPRILETVQGIIAAIPSVIETAWPVVRDSFMSFVEETFGSDMADKVRDVFNTLHGVFERLGEKLGELGSVVQSTLLPALQGAWEVIAPFIEEMAPKVMSVIETILGGVIDVATGITEHVSSLIEAVTPMLDGILETVSNILDGIKTTVEGVVGFVVSFVTGDFEGMASSLSTIWEGIKSTIKAAIDGAKDAVKSAIDKIKGFFSFEFKWPHIPLPHFSISGSVNPLDWLSGGLPSISVSWYAKGGIVDGATLIGAGEAGPEAIIPLYEPYFSKWGDAIAEHMGGAGTVNNYYIDGNMVAADAALAAALDTVAQRVGGMRRMGVA